MGQIISRPSNWITVEGTCYELGHTWSPSCMYSSVEVFLFVFYEAIKIYLPLYLLGDILRRRHPLQILKSTPQNVLRSSLFLAVNGGGFVSFICLLRKLFGCFYFLSVSYLPAFCSSFCAILVERKSRRGLLTSYVCTIAIESLYRMMKYRGYFKPVPFGEVLMFCLGSAVLLYNFKSKSSAQDFVSSILSVLFKPKLPVMLRLSILRKYPLLENIVSLAIGTSIVSMWSFGLGYSIQAVINAIQLGHRIVKDPSRIKQALTKPYNVQFGKFLASFTALFKLTNSLLFLTSAPRDVRLLVSGLFAGLSMLHIRSNSISLYVAVKAIEVLFFKAVQKGLCRSYHNGDIILYSIFTATIFHAALFEAHNIRLSYWRFIDTMTKGRIRMLNYDAVDLYQTDASQLLRMINAQEQMEKKKQQQQKN